MNLDATVARLADLESIRDLARRYAHCVWQRDAEGAAALFAEDAVMDTGDRPPVLGRAALFEVYRAIFAVSEFHPTIHNHVIDLDGDSATGTCYLELEASIGGACRKGSGYYEDRYSRVAGEWKFQSRKLSMCYLVDSEQTFTA